FEVELAQAGLHTFEVELGGYQTLRSPTTAKAGDRDVRLVLTRRPTATLRIVDAVSGAPLPRCGAALQTEDCVVAEHADGRIELSTSDDRDLIRVEADAHVPCWIQLARPGEAETGQLSPGADGAYVVKLAPELVATLRVLRDGAPVPNAVLR